jgi:hypothetical protein
LTEEEQLKASCDCSLSVSFDQALNVICYERNPDAEKAIEPYLLTAAMAVVVALSSSVFAFESP